MKSVRCCFATLVAASLLAATPVAAQAGEIVLAHPGSPYGDTVIYVIRTILADRLGIQSRAVHASAPVMFKAMDANKGDIDIDPVMQMPNNRSLVDEYVARKGTVIVSPNFWQYEQGACTITPVAEKYGIKTIYDMTRPEVVHLTAKSGDGKGEFWVGAADWNSAAIDKVRARFYGLDQLYALTTSQADLEYARVSNAIKAGAPIFWACDTASNFIFPKDAVAKLAEPPHDPDKWHPVLPSADPDWFQKSSIETSWPPVTVRIAYAKHLQTDFPQAARLLERMALTREMAGAWTYAYIAGKQDLDALARQWVKENPTIVDTWLAP